MKATLFLGAGRITSALVAGLRLAGDRRRIMVYDRHPEKLRAFGRESRVEIARTLKSAVEQAEMLMVAVRPDSVKEILSAVAACGAAAPGLCVSLAAGVPLGNLRAWLGRPAPWVRAMPSPICRIDRGLTGLCFESRVSPSQRQRVRKFFEQVGGVVEIPEELLDVFTAAYSPSHGYHALARLAKAAQDAGLDRATALSAAAHALSDGILYCREAGLRLDELLQEAATPGGTARATMAAMDKAGYARVVASGLKAGIRQARAGGKL
jgi:pyrroline-5-carboxylate reductase